MTDFSGWSHYQDIEIDGAKVGSTGAPHGNFPVAIDLDDLTVTSHAKADGSDLRFALTDDTQLDYGLVSRGAYVCRDGVWTWYNWPVAFYDSTGSGALYVGVFNGANDDYVRCWKYDFGTKAFTVGEFQNGDHIGDDHNCPAICQRSDGKLLMFAPSHNNGTYTLPYRVSTNARDPTAWGTEKTITGWTANGNGVSYAQVHRLPTEGTGDTIRVYTREKSTTPAENRWMVATSTDDGDTFGSITAFWDSGGTGPYVLSNNNGSRIDFLLTYSNPADADGKAVYHIYFDGSDGTYRASDGSLLNTDGSIPTGGFTAAGLPAACEIIDGADATPDDNVWNASIDYNSAGNPVALLIVYKGGSLTTTEAHWGEYSSGWSTEKIADWSQLTANEPEYQPHGCIDPSVTKGVWICLDVSSTPEMQRWQDTGSGWAKQADITTGSDGPNFRPFAAHNHPRDGTGGEVVWCQGGFYDRFTISGGGWESAIRAYPALDSPFRGARVRVPSLPSSGNTTIRVYAGNVTATDAQNYANTFTNAIAVPDFGDGDLTDGRALIDRGRAISYDMQNFCEVREDITTTVHAMQLSSAAVATSTTNRIEGAALDLSALDGLTVECIARYIGSGSAEHTIISNFDGGSAAGFLMRLEPVTNELEVFVDVSGNTTMSGNSGSSTIADNTDYALGLVFDGNVSGDAVLYRQINATRAAVDTDAGVTRTTHPTAQTDPLRMFRWPTADALTGAIGEIRIWPEAKPAGWSETYYNNFFDADFYAVGAEQSQGALLPILAAHGAYLGAN